MALQFSVKLCRERAFGFCLLWKKAGKRTNCINSCSLAYLSHFLTMTSILSRETRKERGTDYVWGLHPPFLVSFWLQEKCTARHGPLLSKRTAEVDNAGRLPARTLLPSSCLRCRAEGSTRFWLSWLQFSSVLGPLGNAPLKIAPPWSFAYTGFVVVLFSKDDMEKCLSFTTHHTHTLWLLLQTFAFFSRAANYVFQTWFKDLTKQAKRKN